jgi:D-alanyl-D-alanine carboxypeptidase
MTSGLFNYSEDTHFQKACFASPARTWTPPQLLAVAFAHPPRFAPGKGFEYSNTNTILLGMVIERITGRSVADALRTRIFQPLGMRHTLFPRDASIPAPYAHGYVFGADIDRGPSQAATLIDVTHWNPSWGWTAGAVISTLDDLSRYIRPLAKGSLVSASAQAMRLAGMDLRPGARSYGFAIANIGGAIGHNGALPGYQSFAGYLPDRDTTVIVLTNLYQTRTGKGPADQLAALIIERLPRR